jgi:hypothetical protein
VIEFFRSLLWWTRNLPRRIKLRKALRINAKTLHTAESMLFEARLMMKGKSGNVRNSMRKHVVDLQRIIRYRKAEQKELEHALKYLSW